MTRQTLISVRLAQDEREIISRAAAAMRLAPSQYVRWVSVRHAEKYAEKMSKGGEGNQTAQKA